VTCGYLSWEQALFVSELGRQDLWNKWCELAALAAATYVMRGTLGEIASAPGGREVVSGVLAECAAVATACGHALESGLGRYRSQFLGHVCI